MSEKGAAADIQAKFKEATDKHKSGDLYSAEYAYLDLLEELPEHPKLNYFLGVIHLHHGLLKSAIARFNISLGHEHNVSCKHALITAYSKNKDYEQVIELALDLLREEPDNQDVSVYLAQAYMEMEDYVSAEALFRKLFVGNEKDPLVHASLGELFRRQGKLDWALGAFQSARNLDQNNMDGLVGFGKVCFEKDDIASAESTLRTALKIDDKDPRPHLLLGEIFYHRAQYEWAASAAKSVLVNDPSNYDALVLKARSHAEMNENCLSENAYMRAFYINPDSAEIKLALAKSCIKSGNLHWAVGLFTDLASDPDCDSEVLDLMTLVLIEAGREDAGLSHMREGLLSQIKENLS